MLFTAFQYVPILEEDTPGHKVELAKKNDFTDGDSDSSYDDFDDESEALFDFLIFSSLISFYSKEYFSFTGNMSIYQHQLGNIHTPPPKV